MQQSLSLGYTHVTTDEYNVATTQALDAELNTQIHLHNHTIWMGSTATVVMRQVCVCNAIPFIECAIGYFTDVSLCLDGV